MTVRTDSQAKVEQEMASNLVRKVIIVASSRTIKDAIPRPPRLRLATEEKNLQKYRSRPSVIAAR